MRLLRQHDRWVQPKPQQNGTGKPAPYKVQAIFCTNIEQTPGARNNMVSTIVSIPGHCNKNKKPESVRL